MFRIRPICAAGIALLMACSLPLPAHARSERAEKLEQAVASKSAVRSVYFVEGMACRACTLLLDRYLAGEEGVLWARFNYPLRLFTAYHEPAVMSVAKLEEYVDRQEELDVVLVETGPASGFQLGNDAVAVWKGGSYGLDEALTLPPKFEQGLRDYMLEEGTSEWYQVIYEITGEDVRNGILQALSKKKGLDGSQKADLPFVVSKDFYWPSGSLEQTAEESAMARFVSDDILGGETDQKKSIKKFDTWLKAYYKEIGFEFRGEIMELRELDK